MGGASCRRTSRRKLTHTPSWAHHALPLNDRAIAQANITREYLHGLSQNGYKMPSGPVIISPHGLLPSLYRRVC
jgi:phosphatidate phosphatase PAH1